ncbi:MAG: class I adenylate-forming enzyme family protein [Verrucomicrobiales bacterium]
MNAATLLLARGRASAPAAIHRQGILTYDDLRLGAAAVAGWIGRQRFAPGARIGLLAENSPFFIQAYTGILQSGLVAVPLPLDSTPAGVREVMQTADASALLATATHIRRLGQLETTLSCPLVAGEGVLAETASRTTEAAAVPPNAIAALMFTSGSTGRPKGVVVTHGNIVCNTEDIVATLGLTQADRTLLVLPLHYCFGLSVLQTHLWVGASLVINNQFLYPETVLHDITQHGCSGLAGVPSTFQILLRKSRFKKTPLPTLRCIQQAGGRLPSPLIEEIRQAQPHARFFTMYGQTEATARLSILPPERLADKLGSIGRGLPSTRLDVLTPEGLPVHLGSDEVGEIVASGGNVCTGYWRDPEETARYFRGGRLHTGDLARVDADGFVYIVDRERDMIKCGGNRVSPKEIEDVLAAHPGVVEAAVVGVPHDWLGEAVTAFVVATRDGGVIESDLRRLCRQSLPPHKVPEHIRLVAALPHTGSGKVMKSELRRRAAEFSTPFPNTSS